MAQERWQVSDAAAANYERFAVPAFFAAWAGELLKRAALQPGERVLDVACGTGIVARGAVEQVGKRGVVTGVDLNAGMLAEAAKHVPAGFQIYWREGDATELPFTEANVDVVLCQQGLQFFPDKPLAVAEMHRVLAPDGRVVASVWRGLEHNPYPAIQAEALARHLGVEFGSMMAAPFAYGDAGTLSALFRSAGFRDVKVEAVELTPTQSRTPERVAEKFLALPMAEAVAQMPDAARQAMIQDVLSAIPGNPSDPAVLVPTSAHTLTARR
jgi:ubiquinone/menaquinone biosynthesis C-methylase UbiE